MPGYFQVELIVAGHVAGGVRGCHEVGHFCTGALIEERRILCID
jgi:hypothetical protein